jgi:hypothetical protein
MAEINAIYLQKSMTGDGETTTGWCKIMAKAQLEHDAAYYEPLIKQARQDTAREIFNLIERIKNPYDVINQKEYYGFEKATRDIRQSLKNRILGDNEQKEIPGTRHSTL